MESHSQNPEFRNNPGNFHSWCSKDSNQSVHPRWVHMPICTFSWFACLVLILYLTVNNFSILFVGVFMC